MRCDHFMEINPHFETESDEILNFMRGPTEHEYQNFILLMQKVFDELDWDEEKYGENPLDISYYESSIKKTLTNA